MMSFFALQELPGSASEGEKLCGCVKGRSRLDELTFLCFEMEENRTREKLPCRMTQRSFTRLVGWLQSQSVIGGRRSVKKALSD
jgi:hypothetical protein